MLKEFKEFALKGNIMDMAVGVVIGGAFQKIVNSLVNDIIMPAISILIGKVDFSDMVLKVGNASIKYGSFITSIVDFLIIAFSIFIALKYINKLNKIPWRVSMMYLINEKINNNLITTLDHHHHYSSKGL